MNRRHGNALGGCAGLSMLLLIAGASALPRHEGADPRSLLPAAEEPAPAPATADDREGGRCEMLAQDSADEPGDYEPSATGNCCRAGLCCERGDDDGKT